MRESEDEHMLFCPHTIKSRVLCFILKIVFKFNFFIVDTIVDVPISPTHNPGCPPPSAPSLLSFPTLLSVSMNYAYMFFS